MSKTGPVRQQIGPLKHHANKQKQKAETLLAATIPEPDNVDDTQAYIEQLQIAESCLQFTVDKLQTKHDEWAEMVVDLPDEQTHYEKAADEILSLLCDSGDTLHALDARLKRLEFRAQQATQMAGQDRSRPTSGITPSHPKAFKTAKISLPKFSGDYMEFKQFWGVFQPNIHDREDLTNVEKFSYLLTQLEGDAKKALSGVLISEENYSVAVGLLKSRFDRADERLVTMLYSSFMQISVCNRKIEAKRKTLDECERIFRQLESAGEDVNSNRSLVCGLLSKFPGDMVKDLQRFYGVGPNDKLSDVREGLRKSIAEEETTTDVLGDLQNMKIGKDGPPENRGHQGRGFDRFPPDSALAAGDRRTVARGSLTPPCGCYFCGGRHFNGECTAYRSAPARLRRLYELNLCSRCMKPHPRNVRCVASIRCIHCRSLNQHTSPLCPIRYPETSGFRSGPAAPPNPRPNGGMPPQCPFTTPNRWNPHPNSGPNPTSGPSTAPNNWGPRYDAGGNPRQGPATFPNNRPNSNGPSPTCPATTPFQPSPFPNTGDPSPDNGFISPDSGGTTALNHTDVRPALFQTAKTTAVNPVTGQTCTVRLAMDTLSSRSYIRQSVANKLGLANSQNERLFVSVFGTSKTLEVPTSRVDFEVCLRDGTRVSMEANTTKIICRTGALLNNWSEQENKALSQFWYSLADDPFDQNNTIDILVGAGQVWDFIDGARIATSAPNLFLIPSKFGLMLSGESQSNVDDNDPTMLCITESTCQYPSEIGLVSCESNLHADYPDIDEFWDLEKIGISDDAIDNDDDRALEHFLKTVHYQHGRYEVALPWIDEKKSLLPSNYDLAYYRFKGLSKPMKENPDLFQANSDVLDRYIIVQQVPVDERDSENLTHHMPHHRLCKPSSNATKVRIVHDVAAKSPCLNSQFQYVHSNTADFSTRFKPPQEQFFSNLWWVAWTIFIQFSTVRIQRHCVILYTTLLLVLWFLVISYSCLYSGASKNRTNLASHHRFISDNLLKLATSHQGGISHLSGYSQSPFAFMKPVHNSDHLFWQTSIISSSSVFIFSGIVGLFDRLAYDCSFPQNMLR